MNKQQRINILVSKLIDFIEENYSSELERILKETKNEYLVFTLNGIEDSSILLWTENEEVTIEFGESHWHVGEWSEPCDYDIIYENAIEDVTNILKGKVGTYSCWKNNSPLGGGSFDTSSPVEEIMKDSQKFFSHCNEIRLKKWGKKHEILTP